MLKTRLWIFIGLLTLISSCELTFRPVPSGVIPTEGHTYKIVLPPDFNNASQTRRYPLVIGLHGATSSPDAYFVPELASRPELARDYPAVVLAPNSPAGYGTSEAWIRRTIEGLIINPSYRIDESRIYIVGFSMGGFGCTQLVRDLYKDYGRRVTAVVPSGGGNYPDFPEGLVRLTTKMWIHYGLNGDFSQESDYTAAKTYLAGASEVLESDLSNLDHWDGSLETFHRETRTLVYLGKDLFKISTYAEMGHSTGPIYQDPKVLDWLFAQRLD